LEKGEGRRQPIPRSALSVHIKAYDYLKLTSDALGHFDEAVSACQKAIELNDRLQLRSERILMEPKPDTADLDRRRALKQISLIFGAVSALPVLKGLSPEALLAHGRDVHQHAASGSAAAVAGTSEARLFFNPHQFETVDVICEILIPQTKTPGARAARVPQFIDLLLTKRETRMQEEITAGLKWLDQRSIELFEKDFIEVNSEQQIELLTRISSPNSSEAAPGKIFFNQLKDLTVFGYYTSKEGLEEELGYAGPMGIGSYEGSVRVERA
jgi:hypothetical protein